MGSASGSERSSSERSGARTRRGSPGAAWTRRGRCCAGLAGAADAEPPPPPAAAPLVTEKVTYVTHPCAGGRHDGPMAIEDAFDPHSDGQLHPRYLDRLIAE